jgi:beta-galactosidase
MKFGNYIASVAIVISLAGGINKTDAQKPWFSVADLITTGVYYYPEHWDSTQWERDLKNISAMGFEFVHYAEFAWVMVEPEEGKFTFGWLDKAVDLAAKHGLKVVMCTPTPTPPAWLATVHPEIFLWDENFIPQLHGARQNVSTCSDVYRKYVRNYVTELAKHYGSDNRIMGWQVDNEPYAPEDFSPEADAKFRIWLKNKYQTIGNLNLHWGSAFWGMNYNDFDQIRCFNPSHGGSSPHAYLDYKRFSADMQAEFLNFQADIIRKYSNESQWVTTNYTGSQKGADARRSTSLDFSSYTMYPIRMNSSNDPLSFRLGDPKFMNYANAFYRPINGVTGVMELQPGQVNWGEINPQPQPGAVRMWLFHAWAAGSDFACTYRYRQPLYGSEQYHAGIVGTDGVSPSRGGLEYRQFMQEIRKLRDSYKQETKMPEEIIRRKTAILWQHENWWDIDFQKQTSQWNTFNHMSKYLDAALSCGAPADLIGEKDNFADYKVLIAPAYQLVDTALVARWTDYVQNGGNLVLTCRTAQKDLDGQLWQGPWASPILKLIGAKIDFFDLMMPETKGVVKMNGKEYAWNNWGDVLSPGPGTKSLAVYANQFYAGKSAAISRKLGKGTVTYVGVDSEDGVFEKDVLKSVYNSAGINTENYPKGIYVFWREGFKIAVNYSSGDYQLAIPSNTRLLVGEKTLKPAGVAVWK